MNDLTIAVLYRLMHEITSRRSAPVWPVGFADCLSGATEGNGDACYGERCTPLRRIAQTTIPAVAELQWIVRYYFNRWTKRSKN